MASKKELAEKIRQMFGGKVEVWSEQDEVDPDKPIPQPNRREKRLYGKERGKGGTGKVHDTLRLGARPGRAKRTTGQPLWFRQMKYDQLRRKALEKVELDRLAPAVGRVAEDLYRAGYKNVWQLTQVENVNTLLRVGHHDNPAVGISHKELKKLRDYLIQQRVPVKWEA